MKKFPLYLLIILILILSFIFLEVTPKETVSITGSTTVMPLVERCAEEFNRQQDDVRVIVGVGGSGVGIKNVALGFSDMGMASRKVNAEEIEIYGDEFREFLIAYDAVAIAVSLPIYDSGVEELSRDQARAIYDGKITSWKDLGGPDVPILVVSRLPGSGTEEIFNEMVMDDPVAESLGANIRTLSNAETKTAITGSDKAIGYLGLNYVQKDGLSALAYEGVEPSVESIKNGSYPLARPLYLVTWGEPGEGEREFLDFVLGENGQSIAEAEGFVPVR